VKNRRNGIPRVNLSGSNMHRLPDKRLLALRLKSKSLDLL